MNGQRVLRPEELSSIFDDAIKPWVEARLAQAEPGPAILVLVGAQPGAGKTRAVSRASQETGRAVTVVGDDLRRFHPDYARLMREEPLRMPEVTAQAAGAWARMSSDYLREQQASVVFETTFRQPDAVVATAKEFRDAGYLVEVRALAVPEAVSRLGVLSRYAEQVRDQGAGRWTPQTFHDRAAAQMPKSLERAISEGHIDRVLVVDRAGRTLYAADIDASAASVTKTRDGSLAPDDTHVPDDARVPDDAHVRVGAQARAAVEAGRQLGTIEQEGARAWLGVLDRDANDVLDKADLGNDVLATISDLRSDGNRVLPLAHAPNSPGGAAAASRLSALGARTSAARDALERGTSPHAHAHPGPQLNTKLETTLVAESRQHSHSTHVRAQQPALNQER